MSETAILKEVIIHNPLNNKHIVYKLPPKVRFIRFRFTQDKTQIFVFEKDPR